MSSSGSPLLSRLIGHPIATDVAISAEGQALAQGTYGAIFARARAIAGALRGDRASLEGARVAILIEPRVGYVDALLGVLLAGGAAVPLSPLHTAHEIEHVFSNATPSAVIVSRALEERVLPFAAHADKILLEDTRAASMVPDAPTEAASPAIVLYTSGTTGKPKGVVLSHGAVAATLASLETAWRWQRSDRLLHVLPLHHTHGVIVALLGALWAGASAHLVSFEAKAVWQMLDQCTVLMAVPTMYHKLMEAMRAASPEEAARWSASAKKLRLLTSGSAALSASLLDEFERATGQRILERYGMTEIGMALSNAYEGPRVAGAVGRELSGVQVDIIDESGHVLGAGGIGELAVKSPQMFSEYLGDAVATSAAFDAEGRFRTGDTGTRDEHGVVRLLGRTSTDIIKSGGYKLSALEIEEVIRQHPSIAEVAVLGMPDETWGERVTACVVMREGHAPNEAALRAWCKENMAGYKVPRAWIAMDSLPRTPLGKVQKKELRARLGEASR